MHYLTTLIEAAGVGATAWVLIRLVQGLIERKRTSTPRPNIRKEQP